jgi:flagellar basal-body rod protein FlgG
MAIMALHAGATGLRSLDTKLNVLANNLANINTTGFKRSRVNFEDLMYQIKLEPGLRNSQDQFIPHGIQVGLGSKVSGTQLDFEVGNALLTDRKLDLFVEGEGFFRVKALRGGQEIEAYTRAGAFTLNAEGNMVMVNSVGSILEPQITVPNTVNNETIKVGETGVVSYTNPGEVTDTQAGQIELARFVNPEGLKQIGKNLYIETEASGTPILGNPGEEGIGTILQGVLEGSNVDPAEELVELILTQRGYELNSQSIQSADESLQVVSQLRR